MPLDHALLWEVEIHGQGNYRRQKARAGLSRTDWEIAFQEQQLAVRVLRAFATVLYLQEKLRLLEDTLRLNRQLAGDVRKLLDINKLRGADLILAETEVDLTQSLYDTGHTDLVTARYALRRALGTPSQLFLLRGSLRLPPVRWDRQTLRDAAYQRRADLHARQAAVAEADANLRLTVANRFGNPTLGPAYTYDPTRVNEIGVQLTIPLPVLNTHQGDIAQRQAERDRALADLRDTAITIQTDVEAALARLEVAQRRAENFRSKLLPRLQQGVMGLEKLFAAGEPGVDVLRILDVRRKLLQARSSYLDTLWK